MRHRRFSRRALSGAPAVVRLLLRRHLVCPPSARLPPPPLRGRGTGRRELEFDQSEEPGGQGTDGDDKEAEGVDPEEEGEAGLLRHDPSEGVADEGTDSEDETRQKRLATKSTIQHEETVKKMTDGTQTAGGGGEMLLEGVLERLEAGLGGVACLRGWRRCGRPDSLACVASRVGVLILWRAWGLGLA